jgi:hypothetical protein
MLRISFERCRAAHRGTPHGARVETVPAPQVVEPRTQCEASGLPIDALTWFSLVTVRKGSNRTLVSYRPAG